MARPDTTPLSITPDALRVAVTYCNSVKSDDGIEACGLIFGSEGVARRVVPIPNVHPDPVHNFAMQESSVLQWMRDADDRGDDLVSVFHSHPFSASIPSESDKATPDAGPGSPAYLIVGLADPNTPSCRAWRIDLEYIGTPRATEVLIHISDDGQAFAAAPPLVPWALTPGNKVLLTYQRPGHHNRRTITTEINGHSDDVGETGKIQLSLTPRQGTDPKVMLLERIRAVRVLRESPSAGRVRQRSALYARALAHCVEHDEFSQAADYARYLTAAYPTWLAHVEGDE